MNDVTSLHWSRLRAHTPARIGLARAGTALSTRDQLAFQMAHAQAQDAVHGALDVKAIIAGLTDRGMDALALRSAAPDRAAYLQRPDLGRRLHADAKVTSDEPHDVAFVIADGLSALAVQKHALPLFDEIFPALFTARWTIAPVAVVEQGRVAIGDEIGAALKAQLVVVLIGERPGLSSPDSLGVYITWEPRIGRTDAERNCISNVRPEGLSYTDAAARVMYLLTEARKRKLSGVMLKDETEAAPQITERHRRA